MYNVECIDLLLLIYHQNNLFSGTVMKGLSSLFAFFPNGIFLKSKVTNTHTQNLLLLSGSFFSTYLLNIFLSGRRYNTHDCAHKEITFLAFHDKLTHYKMYSQLQMMRSLPSSQSHICCFNTANKANLTNSSPSRSLIFQENEFSMFDHVAVLKLPWLIICSQACNEFHYINKSR